MNNRDLKIFKELTKKYFIPLWYDKYDFEEMIDKDISDKQWEKFLNSEWSSLIYYDGYDDVLDFFNAMANKYFEDE